MKLNKTQFIELLAARNSSTVSSADTFLNTTIDLIYELLAEGKEVNLSGFGKFLVSHRKPRLGVNPRTLTSMMLPEYNNPKFRAGEALKRAVNIKRAN